MSSEKCGACGGEGKIFLDEFPATSSSTTLRRGIWVKCNFCFGGLPEKPEPKSARSE